MDPFNYIGTGQRQMFVAPFIFSAAKIFSGQVTCLQLGTHSTIDNQNAFGKGFNNVL